MTAYVSPVLQGGLHITDLHVALDAEAGLVRAIDGLSLAIQRGETFALVGESGCGKSMTALALMRLLPDNGTVTGGSVRLGAAGVGAAEARPLVAQGRSSLEPAPAGGRGSRTAVAPAVGKGSPTAASAAGDIEVLDLPESGMRAVRGGRIGMIFQEPGTSLNPVLRVGEQIVEAIEAHTPLRGAAARAKAIDWLRRVGIPEPERRIDDYPFRMSGGQKQRVMIAMTLAAEPDFLVADEPTTALDVTIQAQILDLLRDLQREHHMGLLLITHDLAVVAGMAQRVALMYAGQIIEVAEAADFFSAPRHPYAQALLRALPDAARRGQPLQAIAGNVPPLWLQFTGCRFAERCSAVMPHCASTVPALLPLVLPDASGHPDHLVRCLLYGADADIALDAEQSLISLSPGRREGAGEGPVQSTGLECAVLAAPSPQPAAASGAGNPTAAPSPAGSTERNTTAAPLLSVQDLRVRFPIKGGILQRTTSHFDAVAGISFDVAPGQTLALVGESGCGKTTTGKAIVQLLRSVARVEGRALLDGRDLFALSGDDLLAARRDVQIIFQDPFASLNPRMRVFDLLEEGLVALRPELDAPARRSRLEGLTDQVGLRRDALLRYPHEFSGGQRQRIAIARALAVQPRLIVCDEPTSALDVSVQAQILNLLKALQRDTGVAFLFITHNIGVVAYIADRVAVMRNGRIEEQGDCDAVLQHPQSAFTQRLLASVPRL